MGKEHPVIHYSVLLTTVESPVSVEALGQTGPLTGNLGDRPTSAMTGEDKISHAEPHKHRQPYIPQFHG